jgi:biopolymer transport protein ExbD
MLDAIKVTEKPESLSTTGAPSISVTSLLKGAVKNNSEPFEASKVVDENGEPLLTIREDKDGHIYYDNHAVESAKLKKTLTDIQPDHQTKTGEEAAELSKDRLFQWLSNVNENAVSKAARRKRRAACHQGYKNVK